MSVSTITRLKQYANSRIGWWLDARGYAIMRKYRVPSATLNMLEVGLATLAGRMRGPIRMVQVGAFDGDYVDPAKSLIESGVEAILLEPQPEPAAQLVEQYKENALVHIENAALAPMSGQGTLYRPRGSGPSARATLMPEVAAEIGSCEEIRVSLISSSDLLAKYEWAYVHILQIDAEGYDQELLKLFFAGSIYPEVINLESFKLSESGRKELTEVLSANDYQYLDWGYDTFAMRRSHLHQVIVRKQDTRS
jgi:FkbM family methyltransferase